MADVEDLRIILRTEVEKAVADLKKGAKAAKGADKDFGDLAKQFKRQVTEATSMQRAFTQMAGSVAAGLGVFTLASKAFRSIGQYVGQSVEELRKQDQAMAKAAAVIRATGGAAGLTAQDMDDLGTSLQASTNIAGDAILNMQGMLATFKSISGATFKDATRLAVDLSAAFGRDLQSSAMMVGKALEDPVRGITAMRRAGVSFTQAQQDMIKVLVETGKKGEAQTLILKELESQVGGVAAAMADNAYGAMVQFGHVQGDIKEEVGRFIIEGLEPLATVFIKVGRAIHEVLKEQNDYNLAIKAAQKGTATNDQKLLLLQEERKLLEQQVATMERQQGLTEDLGGHTQEQYEYAKKALQANRDSETYLRMNLRGQQALTEEQKRQAEEAQRTLDAWQVSWRRYEIEADAAVEKTLILIDKQATLESALGNDFDGTAAKMSYLKQTIEELLEIPLDQIDDPFKIADRSIQELVSQYLALKKASEDQAAAEKSFAEVMKGHETVRERLNQLYGQTEEGVAAAKAETIAFAHAQLVLAQASGASEDELAKLEAILRNLTQSDSVDAISSSIEELNKSLIEMSKSVAGGAFLDFFEALGSGADGADAFSQAFGRMVQDMARQTSQLALTAGLKMLATPGGTAIGLALLAMAGVSASFGGAIGRAMEGPRTVDYGKYIVDPVVAEEKRLAEERIRLLREQLATEKKIRDDNLRALDSYFNQEFTVLRDQWERNLISTSDYETQATALRARQEAGRSEIEAPYNEAEAALQAEAEAQRLKKQQLEDARQAKLDLLARQANEVQNALNKMSFMEKLMTNHDEAANAILGLIDVRINAVSAATTIEQVQRAATGADFVTRGPQLLMVGDNPGGRERVKVEPIGSPNLHGPRGEGLTIQINGPVYGIDHLYETLEAAGKKLQHQRRVKGSVFA